MPNYGVKVQVPSTAQSSRPLELCKVLQAKGIVFVLDLFSKAKLAGARWGGCLENLTLFVMGLY